ncbi:mechanosensitive ion channel family protein [Pelagicoccus sp. SDUM812002]|uniref:mechanosensitive ion channel family protein n=1 Tax=Pelagicoccus sp. SDUM812002 TaxID=3041266 RepID=UPI00280C7AD7|nr:mechanosensitive ion channel family protein [Pelagicoccus sp. SDUM812002]MDQ8185766.1 mechanosensitive ion channel family protein [Pelagicoccus sp. SDUM812002]
MDWQAWLDRIPYNIAVNILVVLLVAIATNFTARRLFERNLRKAMNSERRTGIAFLRNAVSATIFVLGSVVIVYSIPPLRSLAVGFFAGASILAAIIGFASQKAFSNIVSGIFIVLFKPFRVDDIIKIQGEIGTIEDITLRHTVIRALENKRLIYPNSVIDTEPIINWSIRDETAQKFMFISIDFESDLKRAESIILEVAAAHKDLLDFRTEEEKAGGQPLVDVQLLDFNNSMVNFRVPLWAKDLPTAMRMTWDVQRGIKLRFQDEGIHLGRPSQVNYRSEAIMP